MVLKNQVLSKWSTSKEEENENVESSAGHRENVALSRTGSPTAAQVRNVIAIKTWFFCYKKKFSFTRVEMLLSSLPIHWFIFAYDECDNTKIYFYPQLPHILCLS